MFGKPMRQADGLHCTLPPHLQKAQSQKSFLLEMKNMVAPPFLLNLQLIRQLFLLLNFLGMEHFLSRLGRVQVGRPIACLLTNGMGRDSYPYISSGFSHLRTGFFQT